MSSFGFLSPFLLVLIPLGIAALIYAYLKRGRGTRQPYSSLFFLRQLRIQTASRSKFVPPPRFFFELFIIFLLGIGAAQFFLSRDAEKVAVLIDNSLSMAVKLPEGGTALADAIKRAKTYIDSIAGSSSISLFVTAPSLRNFGELELSRRQAEKLLDQINIEFAEEQLEQAVSKLSRDSSYSAIAVYSDKALNKGAYLDQSVELDGRVIYEDLTRDLALNNVSLSGISITREANTEKLELSISNFSNESPEVIVQINAFDQSGQPVAIKRSLNKIVVLSPGSEESILFSPLPENAAAFEVKLQTEKALDNISYDNYAWLVRSKDDSAIRVYSNLSLNQLGLNKLRQLRFVKADLRKLDSNTVHESTTLSIFHRVSPERLPKGPSLFILPTRGTFNFEKTKETSKARVARWVEGDPLTRYLSLNLLSFSNMQPLTVPIWMKEVISTTAGPALIAGEQHNIRYVASGFELFPYEGRSAPLLSVLLLNTLKWLNSERLTSGYLTVPEIEKNMIALSTVPTEPSENKIPGLYLNKEGASNLIAANFFSKAESNTFSKNKISPQSKLHVSHKKTTTDPFNLTWAISTIVLLLLLLDLALFFYRRRAVG